jgi:hypothetical protein
MYKEKIKLYKNYLFNFSSSYTGGGLKRLIAYIEWFNKKGGSHFIVNEKLRGKLDDFSRNTYHYVSVTHFQKLINTQRYVDVVIKEMGKCDFYYSYNIPIKKNPAQIKWFHLSNVLPFTSMSKFNIPYRRRIELWWLGILTKQGFQYCDFVSAESRFSLQLFGLENNKKLLVSVNGSDQEIALISSFSSGSVVKNIAVIVGTYYHKNLIDSYKIYRHLKINNNELKLVIIGDIDTVPLSIKNDPQVELKGVIDHDKTINVLSNSRFYITTSKVENSWNAASEGVFLAKESFISKIPPHCELLQDSAMEPLSHLGTFHPILHVSRDNLNSDKLETWDEIITTMIKFTENNG